MRIEIMEKAIYSYYSGMVIKTDETNNYIYFEVDEKQVTFKKGEGYLSPKCTCDHCSIKSKYYPLCSRKLACIIYLYHTTNKKVMVTSSLT